MTAPPAPPSPTRPALSCVSWVAIAVVALTGVGVMAVEWRNIVVLPLAVAPPAIMTYVLYFRWLRKHVRDDDAVIRMFGWGYLPGAVVASLVELVLTIVFARLLLPDLVAQYTQQGGNAGAEDDVINSTSLTVRSVAFIAATSYITAATVEEVVKAFAVRGGCCCGLTSVCGRNWCLQTMADAGSDVHRRTYTTIALLLAAAMGFSTFENVLYVFQAGMGATATQGTPWSVIGMRALMALARGCLSMPVHLTCVAFTALRLTLRDTQRDRRQGLMAQAQGDGLFQFYAEGEAGAAGGDTRVAVAATPAPALTFSTWAPADLRGGGTTGWPNGRFVRLKTKEQAAAELSRSRVWSWPRVLWPSIMVHGTFDFVAMLMGSVLTSAGASSVVATGITLVLGVAILVVSFWISLQQYRGVVDRIAHNDVPDGITFGVDWHMFYPMPCANTLRRLGCVIHVHAPTPPHPSHGSTAGAAQPADSVVLEMASVQPALSPGTVLHAPASSTTHADEERVGLMAQGADGGGEQHDGRDSL